MSESKAALRQALAQAQQDAVTLRRVVLDLNEEIFDLRQQCGEPAQPYDAWASRRVPIPDWMAVYQ